MPVTVQCDPRLYTHTLRSSAHAEVRPGAMWAVVALQLRVSGILVILGLLVEAFTLVWNHPIAFSLSLFVGGGFLLSGIIVFPLRVRYAFREASRVIVAATSLFPLDAHTSYYEPEFLGILRSRDLHPIFGILPNRPHARSYTDRAAELLAQQRQDAWRTPETRFLLTSGSAKAERKVCSTRLRGRRVCKADSVRAESRHSRSSFASLSRVGMALCGRCEGGRRAG
jgi:hypothetical protein